MVIWVPKIGTGEIKHASAKVPSYMAAPLSQYRLEDVARTCQELVIVWWPIYHLLW